MRPRRGVFGPETRRDDEATQLYRVVEEDRRSIRPKDPASLRVGPEMARLRRSRSSTYLPSDTLRRSASHPGHFRTNAASFVFRQSLEPLSPLDHIDVVKFGVRFAQIDDAFNEADEMHDAGGNAAVSVRCNGPSCPSRCAPRFTAMLSCST